MRTFTDEDKTPWYPGIQNPMRVGVYERAVPNRLMRFAWWNGVFWGIGSATPDEALKRFNVRWHNAEEFGWRGLRHEVPDGETKPINAEAMP